MSYPFRLHMDRMFELQGTFSGGDTTWTLPIDDPNVDTIVLSDDFGATSGTIITPNTVSAGVVTVTGTDYSAGLVAIGRKTSFDIELSRPFIRDQNNNSEVDSFMSVHRINSTHYKSGPYTLKVTQQGRSDRTSSFAPATGSHLETFGVFAMQDGGDTTEAQFFVTGNGPRPIIIAAFGYNSDLELQDD